MSTRTDRVITCSWSVFAAVLIGVIGFGLSQIVARIDVLASFDPNEGWNAILASLVAHGEPLYLTEDGLLRGAYTPLSFYLVGALGEGVGDHVLAGRLASLVALFAIGLGILVALARMRADRIAAVLGALYYLGIMSTSYGRYVAINDPHLLAQLFVVPAIGVVVGGWTSAPRIVVSLVLFAAALLTKQTLLAAPLAMVLTMLTGERAKAVTLLAAGAVVLAAITVFALATIGPVFFENLRDGPVFDAQHAIVLIAQNSAVLQLGTAFAVLAALLTANDPNARFILLYIVLSVAFGCFWSLSFAADINHWFDLLIASSLGVGWGLSLLRTKLLPRAADLRSRAAIALVPVLLMVQIPVQAALVAKRPEALRRDHAAREAGTVRAMAFLRPIAGPVLCQDGALCYWAGHRTVPLPWLGTRLVGEAPGGPSGRLARDLLAKIEGGFFAAVQVGRDPVLAEHYYFPAGFFDALERRYERAYESGEHRIYVPRPR